MNMAERDQLITGREQTVRWTSEQIVHFWDFEVGTPELSFARCAGRNIARRAARHLQNARVLDYGCGMGHLIPHILRYAAVASGCDISQKSLAAANAALASLAGFGGVSTPDALIGAGARFDVAILVEVIEHLDDDALDRAFQNLDHLLQDRGSLIVTTPNAEKLSTGYTSCPACGSVFHRFQHVRTWTADTLRAFVESRGYSIVTLAEADFRDFRHLRRLHNWYTGNRRPPNLYCVAQKSAR